MDDIEAEELEVEENDEGNMPWSAFNEYFKFDRETDQGNFLARCKLCPAGPKALKSCSLTSNANLKKHLRGVHKLSEQKIEGLKCTSTSTTKKGVKRKGAPGTGADKGNVEAAPANIDTGSTSNFFKKRRITQKDVDDAVLNLVINERLPYKIVDSRHFRRAVLMGCPDNLKICCRQTFATRLSTHYNKMVANLSNELASVPYVCTTADAWAKHRRSYLGMTCTWLDPKTIQRHMAAFAVRRLKGRHTHKRLAWGMKQVHEKFKVKPVKIRKTITDSGSNFVKAFKVYGTTDNGTEGKDEYADDEGSDADSCDGDGDDAVPVEIDEMLDADLEDLSDVDVELPPHQRCAAHILNLLGSQDTKAALDRNASYKKIHNQTDEKLRTCWRRQNKSNLVAEAIQAGLGVKLQIPGETRWNSEYDAKAQIVKILRRVNGEETFANTLDATGLQKLSSAEVKYLKEFVWVLEPVAIALDLLQKDNHMYMGYLLPTIISLESQLRLRREKDGDGKPLKYCEPLVRTLLEALRKPRRFGPYMADRELNIAACLVPRFKLDWLNHDPGLQTDCRTQILRELYSLSPDDTWCAALTGGGEPATDKTAGAGAAALDSDDDADGGVGDGSSEDQPAVNELSYEDSFYSVTAPLPVVAEVAGVESAEKELERYLLAPRSASVEECYAVRPCGTRNFPRLAQMFLKYNVAVPSSASVERLFWQAGVSFSELRNGIGDSNLECEVMLRVNNQFWR